MATGSLDGFPGVLPDGSGSYSPSPDIADAALAAALAREYFSLTVKDDLGCNLPSFTRQVEAIRPLIGKGVNGQPLLDDLVEMVLLVADLQDLKANPKRSAIGTIVEARMDKSRGPVATALVQTGTLRVGDVIVVGDTPKDLDAARGKRMKCVLVGTGRYAVDVLLSCGPDACLPDFKNTAATVETLLGLLESAAH